MPTPKWDDKFREVNIKFSGKEAEMLKKLSEYYKIDRPACLIRELVLPIVVGKAQQIEKSLK